jgi:hypothetical protein
MCGEVNSIICMIKESLMNIPEHIVRLSTIVAQSLNDIKRFEERQFAYEFYHQFRKLQEKVNSKSNRVMQPEVNKGYQNYSMKSIPDFIFHIPDTNDNYVVIEFKLAKSKNQYIKKDIEKLIKFKTNVDLKYRFAIEVLIGNTKEIDKALNYLRKISRKEGKGIEILILTLNTDYWKVKEEKFKFEKSDF